MAGRRALIIGVDGYSFRPLTSAVNDALGIRDALVGGAGAPPILDANDVTLLATPQAAAPPVAGAGSATRDDILKALRLEYDEDDPAAFLLVYFAGHGLLASEDGRTRQTLILPSDVPGPEEGRNMISITELLNLFAERGPRQQVWIIDACRDMPYEKRPRGYEIDWPEQLPQGQRGQVAIFAVSQGGQALSATEGHGRFTTHILAGLEGKGSAVDFIPATGHCVTAQSLHEYARRRVAEALEGVDAWTRSVQTPQLFQAGAPIDPLRTLPPPPPRSVLVNVRPPEATAAVKLALELQVGFPVPGWPPQAPPRVYELRATLLPGMETDGWGPPTPALAAVDLREQDDAIVNVPRSIPPDARGRAFEPFIREAPQPTTGERGIAKAQTVEQHVDPPSFGFAPTVAAAKLTVMATDVEARVRLHRAEPPWTEMLQRPNIAFDVDPGVWDVLIVIGDEVIGAVRVVLQDGERRVIAAHAQITPATAALLPPVAKHGDDEPVRTVKPASAMREMQGVILPTVLPVLALKLYDLEHVLEGEFAHLAIPVLEPRAMGESSYAVAIAFEGLRPPERIPEIRGGRLAWLHRNRRLALFSGSRRGPRGTITIDWGTHRTSVAAPALPGGATILTARAWPDGRIDISVSVFALPVGRSWKRDEPPLPIGQIARALAVAAPFFRAGDPFEETNENTLTEMAYAKWIDPVLGVLAFHAHDHVLSTHSRPFNEDNRWMLRNMIRSNLSKFFAEVPDSRIVAALDRDLVVRRVMFLDLLKDDGLGQPVLTASLARLAAAAVAERWNDHWSVERFDRVTPGSVFNVVHTAGDNDDGESL